MTHQNFEFLRDRRPVFFRELTTAEAELHAKADVTRFRIRRVAEALCLEMLDKLGRERGGNFFEYIEDIRSSGVLNEFSGPLDRIRRRCNPAVHEIPGEPSSRHINDTIDLLETLQRLLGNWLGRSEPGLVVSEYVEPAQVASPESDADLERILREHRGLLEQQEQRAAADLELATIWEGGKVKSEAFQRLTHSQARKLIRDHVSVGFQSSFKRAFSPDPDSGSGLSETQVDLIEAQARLEEQKEVLSEAQRRADVEHERRVAELERLEAQILTRDEWSNEYPVDDWSKVPPFFQERLLKGLSPFEPWLMPPAKIGEGAHGEVYRCYPSGGGVPVAVKIPRAGRDMKSAKRAWEWELESARKLAVQSARRSIEGVPRPLAISPKDHIGYVIYELVDGRSLRENLRDEQIHPRRALYLTDRLMGILRRLLDVGIRFTDLADRNVMIRRDGEPALVDLAPCIASEANPPEWDDGTRFTGAAPLVRSGHYYMLGRLFLRMIGAGEQQPSSLHGSVGSFGVFLESPGGDSIDVRKSRQRAAILDRCGGISGLDAEGIADHIEDCTFNPEVRGQMKPDVFIRTIRSLYDPSGIVQTIYSGS
ncbi:hypothetical protein OAG62_00545 [bacterium]|nr:hypothetical protein [bacterium]